MCPENDRPMTKEELDNVEKIKSIIETNVVDITKDIPKESTYIIKYEYDTKN